MPVRRVRSEIPTPGAELVSTATTNVIFQVQCLCPNGIRADQMRSFSLSLALRCGISPPRYSNSPRPDFALSVLAVGELAPRSYSKPIAAFRLRAT